MDDSDTIPTISGSDVIMAYNSGPRFKSGHKMPEPKSRLCSCFFWSRYSLFILNFCVWISGIVIVGLGSWTHIQGTGVRLFSSLFTQPSILLICTGIAMVIVGVIGCMGALRLNIKVLRVFMLLTIGVFIMQLAVGAVVFFLLDTVEKEMLDAMRDAVIVYGDGSADKRDDELEYLQKEYKCCGASSFSDWEANFYFNCSSSAPTKCGVPSSCCRGEKNQQCGYKVREATAEYTKMFIYTDGCIVVLMDLFKDNVIIIASISFAICALQFLSLMFANTVTKYTVNFCKPMS